MNRKTANEGLKWNIPLLMELHGGKLNFASPGTNKKKAREPVTWLLNHCNVTIILT